MICYLQFKCSLSVSTIILVNLCPFSVNTYVFGVTYDKSEVFSCLGSSYAWQELILSRINSHSFVNSQNWWYRKFKIKKIKCCSMAIQIDTMADKILSCSLFIVEIYWRIDGSKTFVVALEMPNSPLPYQGLWFLYFHSGFFSKNFGKYKPYHPLTGHPEFATEKKWFFLAISNKLFPYQADNRSFQCQAYKCPVAIAAKDGHQTENVPKRGLGNHLNQLHLHTFPLELQITISSPK